LNYPTAGFCQRAQSPELGSKLILKIPSRHLPCCALMMPVQVREVDFTATRRKSCVASAPEAAGFRSAPNPVFRRGRDVFQTAGLVADALDRFNGDRGHTSPAIGSYDLQRE
jgi:hypothetical protein